ncbi:CD40 ligand-like [Conger conger]|uniref:CD40 ligand-like n=1 Tax=Conger conger TaxID=82655 RepID=UPI002A5AD720|nr:CD40 ligand-like [Conger conger]
MINTCSASLPPPPVPPRPGSQSSTRNRTKTYTRVLSAVYVVHTVVTVALFLYLFQRIGPASSEDTTLRNDLIVLKRLVECNNNMDSGSMLDCKKVQEEFKRVVSEASHPEGKVEGLSASGTPSDAEALAQMSVKQPDLPLSCTDCKTLQWNRDRSIMKNVDYFTKQATLRIRIPGYYFVYSRVTFSKHNSRIPLAHTVNRLQEEADKGLLLKSFCSMRTGEFCTSFQGGIVRLEEGQQLYVNVTDLSLVNFDVTATTFGLFLLRHTP